MDLLAHMKTFASVVETGSLSAAARRARVSLPSVSRQLRALEEHLGAPLLVRSTRRMRLTDAGQRWYEHSVRILREVDAARESVGEGVRGTLVISASITIGFTHIAPRLPALSRKHPRLGIDLRLEDRFVDLVAEGVDVAVRGGADPPDSTAYLAHVLHTGTRVVVASPSYLRKHGTPRTPEHLAKHTCLVQFAASGTTVPWTLAREGELRVAPVSGLIRTNAPIALQELARAGLGLALLPDWVVRDDLASGALKQVLGDWQHPEVKIWALHRAELRGSARVRAFLEAMRDR